jgi:hypothetical protein
VELADVLVDETCVIKDRKLAQLTKRGQGCFIGNLFER